MSDGHNIPSTANDDFLYWGLHKSWKFSVKTAYATLDVEDQGLHRPTHFWICLNFFGPSKFSQNETFLWKLFHNGIATKVNVGIHGIQLSSTYDFCTSGEEDIQHLFRFCDLEKQVWRCGSLAVHSDDWFIYYIRLFQLQDVKSSPTVIYFIATIWGLRLARNEHVFRNDHCNISTIQALITYGLNQHEFSACIRPSFPSSS